MHNNLLFAQSAGGDKLYVEDVFSTYLYTGNGSTQTITNGIDLAGKGGLVWVKNRGSAASHYLMDTNRGIYGYLSTNSTAADPGSAEILSYNSNGFSLVTSSNTNASSNTYASWTFRKAPKFFDVVTWSGNSVAGRTISHSLGVAPGMIIVRRVDTAESWYAWHRSFSNTSANYLVLNTTGAVGTSTNLWNNTAPTATQFTVGTGSAINASGGSYVAYLFAHDTTADGVIQCGSFTSDSSGNYSVNIGWEPQYILIKRTSSTGNWYSVDNMRGLSAVTGSAQSLFPNLSNAETNDINPLINSQGFSGNIAASSTFIYLAIRRGPMRVPTDATKVFQTAARSGTGGATSISTNFPVDTALIKNRAGNADSRDWSFNFFDKLRSPGYRLSTRFTDTEDTSLTFINSFDNDKVNLPATGYTATNGSGYNYINYFLRRAPGFFDVVCYTGTGSGAGSVTHGLGVTPELIIVKARNSTSAGSWPVYNSALSGTLQLVNNNQQNNNFTSFPSVSATTFGTNFYSGGNGVWSTNSAVNYVAYLFASCPGVSKVGTFTGNGSSQNIDCGFTNGARFVLIKRTDNTGDWYVWDTARGIVAANDPHLSLNSAAVEVTTNDTIDPLSSGFTVNQVSATSVNVNAATYVYLAIA